MKKILLLLFFLTATLALKAAVPPVVFCTGTTLTNGNSNQNCNLPAAFNFYFRICDSLAVPGETVNYQIDWNDGTNDSFTGVLTYDSISGWGIYDSLCTHAYNLSGIYHPSVTSTTSTGINGSYGPNLNTVAYAGINCGFTKGRVFIDCNPNCLYSSSEKSVLNAKIILLDSLYERIDSAYTAANGTFQINTVQTDSLHLIYQLPKQINSGSSCSSGMYNFSTLSGPANILIPVDNFSGDFSPEVAPNLLIPGTQSMVNLKIHSLNCTAQNTSATLYFDHHKLTYASTYNGQTPTTIAGDSIHWSSVSTSVSPTSLISNILFDVNSSLVDGDTVCLTFKVYDGLPNNNNVHQVFVPVHSDANPLKMAYTNDIGTPDWINAGDYITYFLNFQNTGTSNISLLTVIDTLDPGLDLSTIELLYSSHNVNMSIEGNVVKFITYDIIADYLIPQENRFSLAFRIRSLWNLSQGTVISNRAWFNYLNNYAYSNDVNRYIVQLPVGAQEQNSSSVLFAVLPNPATGLAVLKNYTNETLQVQIYTSSGLNVRQIQVPAGETAHITGLTEGLYAVRAGYGNKSSVQKIIFKK